MVVLVARSGRFIGFAILLAATLVLSACGGGGSSVNLRNGVYKVGDPYQVAGRWYYPAEDPGYNETGIASWYGTEFHGRATANGERFDMNLFSAAHPTLPMPSHARVTNLNNGSSIVVRINDRGPFASGRIIDLSRAAARELGFEQAGTAPVRVQTLGRAPLNISNSRARDVLEGRRTRATRAETTTVMAAAITPSTSGGAPQVATPTRDLSAPSEPHRDRTLGRAPRLYVQAGSFGQEQNAARMLSTLRNSGQIGNVTIEPTWIDGQRFYRVRVGPYTDVNEADRALSQVAGLGYHGARIIVD